MKRKVLFLYLLLLVAALASSTESIEEGENHQHRLLQEQADHGNDETKQQPEPKPKQQQHARPRILYVVTTLNEYNSGTRSTTKGTDRLQLTLIPVVSEGIRSMIQAGYDVDLFLVCHYTMRPERQALVQAALPAGVGLDVWSDATPMGYDTGKPFHKLEYRTLHLARQHRFVLKDKLMDYNVFVCFEDDMLIRGAHVDHWIKVTNEIQRLYDAAPIDQPAHIRTKPQAEESYHGVMTKGQLARMIPGFIRVEVLLDEKTYPTQKDTGPVPVDLYFGPDDQNQQQQQQQVNPAVCCHVSGQTSTEHIPESPASEDLMLWETNILPLGVRKMPEDSFLDWVVMQRGPSQVKLNVNETIGDYWSNRGSGRPNDFYWKKTRRPKGIEFKYINNQGGWMATREQLWRWHTEICPGGFLPPYEGPHYNYDGLDMRNVEWYSGGMQLSTIRHACNMQRIIMLDPESFSKSLIYHTANNKQRQLQHKREEAFVKANTLLGQLNAVRKRAEKEMVQ